MRGRRQGRNRTLLGALLAFLGAVQMLVAGVLPAPVGAAPVEDGTLLGFEVEGDHDVDTAGNIDWASVAPTVVIDADDPDLGLQGSSKENDPTEFSCQSKDGGITPSKDNIERAYVHTDISVSEALLAIGFVREAGGTQGNAHVNFELNRGEITLGADCEYLGRLDGDLLLVFDFPGNQDDPANTTIYRWNSSISADGQWVEIVDSDVAGEGDLPDGVDIGDFIVAADNAGDITDLVVGGTVEKRAFGEAAIDLAAFDAAVEGDPILSCPGFGTGSIRSRSSGESFNSALQDFLNPFPVDVSTCGDITIKKVDDLGNPMQGVDFDLFDNEEGTGDPIDSCTTDAQGLCTFDEVPPGDNYHVFEDASTVPPGFTAASNPVAGPITVGFKESVDLTGTPIVNPRQTGYVEITKVLAEMTDQGDVPVAAEPPSLLDGTKFRLYDDKNGDDDYDSPAEDVFLHGTTDLAECEVTGGSGACTIGPVATGDYRITETAWPSETTPGPDVDVTIGAEDTVDSPQPATFTNYVSPLQIDLSKDGPSEATIGDTFTYIFDVSLVEETDPPLTDISVVEVVADRCTAAPITGPEKLDTVTDDDWLEFGETWRYTCEHLVVEADGTLLENTARATGTDKFDRDVSAEDGHTVIIRYPDVTVEKVAVDDSLTAGDQIAFDITVSNSGDGVARNVTLTDTLPTGITWSEDSDDCEIADGVLTCDFGDLAAGDDTETVRVSGTTDTGDCGNIENTATVSSTNEVAGATGNNSGTDDVDVSCPDVQIEKSGNGTINAGDDAIFTLTVTNNDQGAVATDVTVSDTLPGDIVWSTTNADCDISAAGVLSCELGDLDPGESVQIVITGSTDPADCGTLPNTATVASTNEAPNGPDNNSDDAEIAVQCPDILIDKLPDDGVIDVGDDAVFTVTVSNAGDGTAYDLRIDDELPGDNITWALDPAVAGCSITGLPGAQTLSCSFDSYAPDAAPIVIVMTGTTDPADCPSTGDLAFDLDNTAFANASNDRAGTDELSDDGRITVNCPDVAITKVADADPVVAGSPIGFTIEVTNDGPGTAKDVLVEDDLPDGFDWSIDPASTDCSISGSGDDQALTCGPADLGPEGSYSVHITAPTTEDDCGSVPNEAFVSLSNGTGDDDADSVLVLCPGLNINKTADAPTIDAGDEAGFTITVSNVDDGDGDPEGTATDVVVTDTLPVGGGDLVWSVDSITPDVGTCTIDTVDGTPVLTCQLGDIEVGESVAIRLVAATDIPDCGVLENVATADPANGPAEVVEDPATVQVLCPLDIDIDKDGPALAHVGDEITYTFSVTNTGEADLVEVVVTDPLCDGEISLDDDADGDTVLAIGETWEYSCTHVITADDADPLPNTATATGTDERDRETDDEDDHLVDIINPAIQIIKTVDNSDPNPGDTITFRYEVTNTGDTPLFDVTVTDDQLGDVGTIDELAPGETVTLTKDDEVQSDQSLVNIGTATGTDELGLEVSDTDDEFINIVLPDVIATPQARPRPAILALTGDRIGLLLLIAGMTLMAGGVLSESARRLGRRRA